MDFDLFMNKQIFLFFIFFIISCTSVNINKDFNNKLVGRITVKLNTRVFDFYAKDYNEDILIQLVNTDNYKIYYTRTDKNGYFLFQNLPPGTYSLNEFKIQQQRNAEKISIRHYFPENSFTITTDKIFIYKDIIAELIPSKPTFEPLFNFQLTDIDLTIIQKMLNAASNQSLVYIEKIDIKNESDSEKEYEKNYKLAENQIKTFKQLIEKKEYYLSLFKAYDAVQNLIRGYCLEKSFSFTENDLLNSLRQTELNISGEIELLIFDLEKFKKDSISNVNNNIMEYTEDYLLKIHNLLINFLNTILNDRKISISQNS